MSIVAVTVGKQGVCVVNLCETDEFTCHPPLIMGGNPMFRSYVLFPLSGPVS
jgi:hypothetical protein